MGTIPATPASPAAPSAADFEARANLHRPTDPAALAAAVRRLHRDGLAARDVAMALRVPIGLVLEALAAAPLGGVPYA